eukprot:CAMPEP_0116129590 /NCGR_PEP_ID=MMETSP0329-20121206/8002_1 /TAXON_ID=697910 /ORGANISM="Pseudo-nitzschia arenysensis, Strain B593" /LENGTH=125 /DNA_ID=CAMNT_0003623861 /DNA_START=71 /DNA_END=448 /DNA_ORIENTATION=-
MTSMVFDDDLMTDDTIEYDGDNTTYVMTTDNPNDTTKYLDPINDSGSIESDNEPPKESILPFLFPLICVVLIVSMILISTSIKDKRLREQQNLERLREQRREREAKIQLELARQESHDVEDFNRT